MNTNYSRSSVGDQNGNIWATNSYQDVFKNMKLESSFPSDFKTVKLEICIFLFWLKFTLKAFSPDLLFSFYKQKSPSLNPFKYFALRASLWKTNAQRKSKSRKSTKCIEEKNSKYKSLCIMLTWDDKNLPCKAMGEIGVEGEGPNTAPGTQGASVIFCSCTSAFSGCFSETKDRRCSCWTQLGGCLKSQSNETDCNGHCFTLDECFMTHDLRSSDTVGCSWGLVREPRNLRTELPPCPMRLPKPWGSQKVMPQVQI